MSKHQVITSTLAKQLRQTTHQRIMNPQQYISEIMLKHFWSRGLAVPPD